MADVTGPISTMPGSRHKVPDGTTCDEHPERLAVARIQGETDSFGSEMMDMCQECLDEYVKHKEEAAEQNKTTQRWCEWGRHMAFNVIIARDPEEGSAGRLYDVCPECYNKHMDYFINN